MEKEKENPEEEPKYELTPEEATNLGGGSPAVLNRKKLLISICVGLAFFVILGVIFNTVKTSKKSAAAGDQFAASRSNSSFLTSLRDSALRENSRKGDVEVGFTPIENNNQLTPEEPPLPPVHINKPTEEPPRRTPPAQDNRQPVQASPSPQQSDSHFRSSLVPQVQGSLFSRNNSVQQGGQSVNSGSSQQNATPYDDYLNQLNSRASSYQTQETAPGTPAQNNQQNNQKFFESSQTSGAVYQGSFLGENALWVGTVIPGILETAINTDLPGHVLARVTQNIYDSQTGKYLLIPQGTLLVARYNNSVSYAQNRVQIIWDTLIRPDGFQIDLEGANGVDRAGMAGQEANYHENWFEYVKAAGVISLFSIANAKLVETANKFSTSSETASNIAQANQQFFNQLGNSLISRAMAIQPTLTVDNGTLINIMLNKTLYLPAVAGFSPSKKYILE
jgi:type IV secretory pathway VirB10-like protein